jgi:hypothetical protein
MGSLSPFKTFDSHIALGAAKNVCLLSKVRIIQLFKLYIFFLCSHSIGIFIIFRVLQTQKVLKQIRIELCISLRIQIRLRINIYKYIHNWGVA